MRIHVRLFAGLREAVGAGTLEVEAPERATVADVLAQLEREHPRLAAYRAHVLLAVDGEFSTPRHVLAAGSTVALMPPVSGGASLHAEPLDERALHAELGVAGAGAVVIFWGLARDEGGAVEWLDFEAFDELAQRELSRVRSDAIAKFGLVDCVIHHRTGKVPVGQAAVGVATSARHRAAAFEAAAWVMDELKARVPIWKREMGRERKHWVNDPVG